MTDALTSLDPSPAIDQILTPWMDKLNQGKLQPDLTLDLLEAANRSTSRRVDPRVFGMPVSQAL